MGYLFNHNKKIMVVKGHTLVMDAWLRRKLRAQGQGQAGTIPTTRHSSLGSEDAIPRHRVRQKQKDPA